MRFITSLFSLTLLSACEAERGLRGRSDGKRVDGEESMMTLRITVFDDLVRQEDESITNVEHIMAIPIEEGVESGNFYSIELPQDIVASHNDLIEQGGLFISVTGARVGMDTITLANDAVFKVLEKSPLPQRKLERSETRKVIVIRVSVASGPPKMRQVAYSAEQIRKHMFENSVSLKRQIERCSGGKLTIQSGGVHDVTIPGQASDYTSPSDLRNVALRMICEEWGVQSAKELADHVIVILPPTNFASFIGNAGVNHWLSTLNNVWSLDVMVYMHELGK